MLTILKRTQQEFEHIDTEMTVKKIDEIADKIEDKYVHAITDEDTLPLFDFVLNQNEGE